MASPLRFARSLPPSRRPCQSPSVTPSRSRRRRWKTRFLCAVSVVQGPRSIGTPCGNARPWDHSSTSTLSLTTTSQRSSRGDCLASRSGRSRVRLGFCETSHCASGLVTPWAPDNSDGHGRLRAMRLPTAARRSTDGVELQPSSHDGPCEQTEIMKDSEMEGGSRSTGRSPAVAHFLGKHWDHRVV
jgi:hypothetical protein